MAIPPSDLSRIRCLHHGNREAVARCPVCREYFCRECVVEHEGRMICASCLVSVTHPKEKKDRRFKIFRFLGRLLGATCAFLFTWFFFVMLGRLVIWSKIGFDWVGDL